MVSLFSFTLRTFLAQDINISFTIDSCSLWVVWMERKRNDDGFGLRMFSVLVLYFSPIIKIIHHCFRFVSYLQKEYKQNMRNECKFENKFWDKVIICGYYSPSLSTHATSGST